jgi:hypothetical protein
VPHKNEHGRQTKPDRAGRGDAIQLLKRLLSQYHLPLGMNPGTPVVTTALNRIRDVIPSEISRTASCGMAEISKFSLMRWGVFEVVSRTVPRWIAQASRLRRGLIHSPGDGSDDRIFQEPGLAAMPQCRERLQHDAILFAIVQKIPFGEVWMRFDVNYCRLDPGIDDSFDLFQIDVG